MPHKKFRKLYRLIKVFLHKLGSLSLPQVVLFLITPLFIIVYLSISPTTPGQPTTIKVIPTPATKLSIPAPLPISKNLPLPKISAKQVFIMDQNSKSVLYASKAQDQLYPASTTKMMTALVSLDHYTLTEPLTITRSYPEGQNISLTPGETLTVEQLLYALLVHSANDAAEVLAQNYPGGRDMFIAAMNSKAKDLKLNSTFFKNPTGLDEDGHYSTAIDLVRLADYALRNPYFAKIVNTEYSVVTSSSDSKSHVLANINQLLGKVEGVRGVKSGLTDKAGQSLITLVDRNNNPVLIAVMGSADRFSDSTALINWTYSNFSWVSPDSLDR